MHGYGLILGVFGLVSVWPAGTDPLEESAALRTTRLEARCVLDRCKALQRFANVGDHRYFSRPGAADDQRVEVDLD